MTYNIIGCGESCGRGLRFARMWRESILVLLVASSCAVGLQLELVSMVFRHGDRSPTHSFPTDQYQEDAWPQGFGQLSLVGMSQQYALGQLLKTRYVTDRTFLAQNYTRVQVRVRSTDVDRTLMSAESQLSALFPPGNDQKFDRHLPWQPIPVHTVPKDEDFVLRASDNYCPRYAELREADKETPKYKQTEKDNANFFKRLEENTGQKPVDLTNIWGIEDIIFIENITEGKTPPSWLEDGDLDRLIDLAAYTLSLMYDSPEKHKITAGLWLGEVLSHMQAKENGTFVNEKLFLYSGHDTTVAPMLSALGVYSGKQPGYASALILELHSDGSKFYVKLFYRSGPEVDFDQLSLSSCTNPDLCTLQEFEQFVSPLIPESWEQACHIPSASSSATNAAVALGVVLVFAIFTSVIVIIVLVLVLCAKKPSYHRLHTKA